MEFTEHESANISNVLSKFTPYEHAANALVSLSDYRKDEISLQLITKLAFFKLVTVGLLDELLCFHVSKLNRLGHQDLFVEIVMGIFSAANGELQNNIGRMKSFDTNSINYDINARREDENYSSVKRPLIALIEVADSINRRYTDVISKKSLNDVLTANITWKRIEEWRGKALKLGMQSLMCDRRKEHVAEQFVKFSQSLLIASRANNLSMVAQSWRQELLKSKLTVQENYYVPMDHPEAEIAPIIPQLSTPVNVPAAELEVENTMTAESFVKEYELARKKARSLSFTKNEMEVTLGVFSGMRFFMKLRKNGVTAGHKDCYGEIIQGGRLDGIQKIKKRFRSCADIRQNLQISNI